MDKNVIFVTVFSDEKLTAFAFYVNMSIYKYIITGRLL